MSRKVKNNNTGLEKRMRNNRLKHALVFYALNMANAEEKEKWQIIQEQVHSMTPEEIRDLDIDWVQKSFLISLKLRQIGDEKRMLQSILVEYKDK